MATAVSSRAVDSTWVSHQVLGDWAVQHWEAYPVGRDGNKLICNRMQAMNVDSS